MWFGWKLGGVGVVCLLPTSGREARMGMSTCLTPWADSFDITTLAVSWAASLQGEATDRQTDRQTGAGRQRGREWGRDSMC